VMYPGDVSMQTRRMLENISALLAEAGAQLKDIAMAVVYLRDAADYSIVNKIVTETCPDLNAVFVLAPVCRPAWLVEMECLALVPCKAPEFRPF
jgi:Putative translation initiation inhibitor, yjgF family